MIYLWNDKKLARDLKANILSEKDKISYLVGLLVVAAIAAFLSGLITQVLHHAASVSVAGQPPQEVPHGSASLHSNPFFRVCSYVYMIAVICLLFRTNNKGDGLHVLERYICLGLPVLVRTCVMGFAFSLVLGFLLGILHGLLNETMGMSKLLIVPLVLLFFAGYYYYRMNLVFKIASGQVE